MILTQSFLDNLTLKHLILQRQVFEGSIKLTEISIIAKFESRFKHDRMKFIKSKSRLSSPLYSWNYKRNYELRWKNGDVAGGGGGKSFILPGEM